MCTAAAIWAKFDGIVFGASQEDAVKWSQDNPQAKFSWRQILTKCKSIADTGEPRLWVRENVLQTECNALFGLIDN